MIANFTCRKTERLWERRGDHGLPLQIERVALRKLTQLHRSRELGDLRLPPGNRLEALTRIFHIRGGTCHTLYGRAALPRRPELGRSSSFALPDYEICGLSGNRAGQHSIRVNDQWRLCFRWQGEDAHDVEIVDYH